MPPRPRISKEMVLGTALEITREEGYEAVNARSIAGRLGCSTQPLFTCFRNMEQLKRELLDRAFVYYSDYVARTGDILTDNPALILPLTYIEFAREERKLFRLLFVNDMELDLVRGEDFYREPGNERKAEIFAGQIGVPPEQGREIFLDLFLYAHGIAVLTASGKASLGHDELEFMLNRFLKARIQQEQIPDKHREQVES